MDISSPTEINCWPRWSVPGNVPCRFGLIRIKFVAKTSAMWFDYTLFTACAGTTVEIRWGRSVGRTRGEVAWKEAVALLDSRAASGLHRVSSLASGAVQSQASASSGPNSSGRRNYEPDAAGGSENSLSKRRKRACCGGRVTISQERRQLNFGLGV